jgi:hypothetical protein
VKNNGGVEAARWGVPERISADVNDYQQKILDQELVVERWRVMRHDRTNALLMTGLRLISLCVEHRLGQPEAKKLVGIVLDTTLSLFKFRDGDSPFGGYILRWDPATTDEWEVKIDSKGVEKPQVCCQFLVNQDAKSFHRSHFLYCTPLSDSRYVEAKRLNHGQDRFRRWEPSMDEYVGLVAGYSMIFHTFLKEAEGGDAESQVLIDKVREQTRLVGRYLQHVGYLLVRPCGGFANRGAAGPNPAYEYPFSRVFQRITGDSFPVSSSATFEKAIAMAGLLGGWKRSRLLSTLAAVRHLRSSDSWQSLKNSFGSNPQEVWKQLGITGETLTGAVEILLNLDVFDVSGDRSEFVVAHLYKQICLDSPLRGFEFFMKKGTVRDSWSDYHKPLIALTALDDDDPFIRDEYLRWYDRFVHPFDYGQQDNEVLGTGPPVLGSSEPGPEPWCIPALAPAVAALLRADDPVRRPPTEQKLEKQLRAMRRTLEESCKGDLVLSHPKPPGREFESVSETHDKKGNWFGYMAPLTLAWLHQIRLGTTVFPDIPVPTQGSVESWPRPVVPTAVINAAHTDRLPVPLDALRRNFFPAQNSPDVDLFDDPPPKPSDNEIGNVPAPVPGPTHKLDHTAMPPLTTIDRTFSLPLPPPLPAGLNESDFACAATYKIDQERNIRSREERREGDRFLIRVQFDAGVVPTSTVPFAEYRTGTFKADCTLSWVRISPIP